MLSEGTLPIEPVKKLDFRKLSASDPLSKKIPGLNSNPGQLKRAFETVHHTEDHQLALFQEQYPHELWPKIFQLSPCVKELFNHLMLFVKDPKYVDFAIKTCAEKSEEEALITLGQLIFYLDNRTDEPGSFEKDFKAYFSNTLEKLHRRIVSKLNEYRKENLQMNHSLKKTILTLAASKMLITKKGEINFGIIPLIIEQFKLYLTMNSNSSEAFFNTLEAFHSSPMLREKIKHFKRPRKVNGAGEDIIRVSLMIEKSKPITSNDAKKAALMASLSYPRQEHVGNCFALSLAISLFSSSLSKCLDDFREILSHGYITRIVEGKKVYFPALLKQPHKDQMTPFKETPQLAHIQKILGLSLETKDFASLEEYLKSYNLLDEGLFIYESETKNPLISVWSNIIASMAEGSSEALLKTAMVSSLMWVAQKNLPDTPMKDGQIAHLKKSLQDHTQLLYDPSIKTKGQTGGFVLYDRKRNWTRIDTPEKFQKFFFSSLAAPQNDYFKSENCLNSILKAYHPASNTKEEPKIYTPWVTFTGHDPKQVIKTYHEIDQIIPAHTFRPHSPQALFNKILSMCKNKYENGPSKIPIRLIGKHTLNLIPQHATFKNAIQQSPQDLLAKLTLQAEKLNLKSLDPSTFLDKLTPSQRQLLETTAIHFADTNFEDDGHDIHFAFQVNPVTLKLDIFETLDNGRLVRINGSLIKDGLVWEVLL
jgi:hypothetical protein